MWEEALGKVWLHRGNTTTLGSRWHSGAHGTGGRGRRAELRGRGQAGPVRLLTDAHTQLPLPSRLGLKGLYLA